MSTTLDLQPVAEVHCGRLRWHIPHDNYSVPLKFTNNDTHLLYDRETVDTAVAAERERHAGWFALVMSAAAALEDAANCLRDPDAKRSAEGAATHYRRAANEMWTECAGPSDRALNPQPEAVDHDRGA